VVDQPAQFSWTLNKKNKVESVIGKSDIDRKAWAESLSIAKLALSHKIQDMTNGALFYHTHYVKPHWAKHMKIVYVSKAHIYYKPIS